jgi:hypothetical protein
MSDNGHPEYLPPPWIDLNFQNPIRPNDTTIRR